MENAFARSIEPHTSYLSPRNADRFNSEMNLSLEGIGAASVLMTILLLSAPWFLVALQISPNSSNLMIRSLVSLRISGKMVDIIGWRLDEVVDLIKGPKGTKVRPRCKEEPVRPGSRRLSS